jgi:hypothetical protein
MEDVPPKEQVSYPSALTYHTNREPPAAYLAHVAKVFGVRMEWLATGEGHMTKAEEQSEIMERAWQSGSLTTHDIDRAFAYLSEDERRTHFDKRAAISRFSGKITDVISASFMEMETRTHVLQCALRFLIGIEQMFDRFGQLDPDNPETDLARKSSLDDLYLLQSSSRGWRVAWQDAVLDLYSRRVKGLGERSADYWDQHAPTGRPPLSDPEDYRM